MWLPLEVVSWLPFEVVLWLPLEVVTFLPIEVVPWPPLEVVPWLPLEVVPVTVPCGTTPGGLCDRGALAASPAWLLQHVARPLLSTDAACLAACRPTRPLPHNAIHRPSPSTCNTKQLSRFLALFN